MAESGQTTAPTIAQAGWREFVTWSGLLNFFGGVFLLFVTITNLLYGLFHFDLQPLFENTLDGFRRFTHFALDVLFYGWFTWLLEQAWYWITYGLSYLLPVVPMLPHISAAAWFKDLALVSLVLSKPHL